MNRRDLITAALATFVSAQTSARVQVRPRFATDPFALGVASGDPSSDGFVLWTRLVGPALRLLDEKAVAVNWEVAADDAFKSIVRRGTATAIAERAHAVHIELHGLEPGRPYWYRFHTGNAVSRIGRTMTAPIAADRFTFAVVSCQHWEQGWFSGYRDILSSSAQAIVHVGDYIYEESFGHGPLVRSFGAPMPTDLAGYRLRHALYKTDAHLQEAHAATPWIVTWDDHEVQNDYAGVHPGDSDDVEHFIPRRRAAYQAYFEHMPLRPSTFRNGAVQMHRRLRWGDLAMLHVLDARQYRDDQPCGTDKEFGGRRIERCDEARDPRRSMLGAEQEAWLYAGLRDDVAPWSLILQQTLFSELNLSDTATPAYWSDIWDGYAANRQRLLDALVVSRAANKVMFGGDVHSFWAADIKADYAKAESKILGSEFVGTCIASRNPPRSMFGPVYSSNPHIHFMDDDRSGYLFVQIERQRLNVDMRMVVDLTNPSSACTSLRRFGVENGRAGVQSA